MTLSLSVDQVLSTTRSVRKRLDMTKPVSRQILEECLDLALQAPNGSNMNMWRWIVIDDKALIAKLAAHYKEAIGLSMGADMTKYRAAMKGVERQDELLASATFLIDALDKVPAMLIPVMVGRPEGRTALEQANMWGSIIPAVWSFFLALRERGLGSAWTTVSLAKEKEIAELLGIPPKYTQVGLFPIAYTVGTDFKKAWRKPVSEVLTYNRF